MRNVVYIDVLFVLNLFINYFILLAAGRLLRVGVSRWRLFCGALLGGLYSLFIFIPDVNFLLSLAAKLIFSLSIVLAAFKNTSIRLFFKLLGSFYLINFAFAGIMMAIWFAFKPKGVLINNGVVYFDVSLLTLAISTILCYLLMMLFSALLRRSAPDSHYYDVVVNVKGMQIPVKGIVDTGNSLCDVFTDTPVMVVEYDLLQSALDEDIKGFFSKSISLQEVSDDYWKPRLRIIPYSSVGREGLLPAFKPEEILIKDKNKVRKRKDVIVAVSRNALPKGDFGALIHPRLVE